MQLCNDERLDYIAGSHLKIIQSPSVFSFSIDAVLLARFAYVPIQKGHLLDLCTGNGVIPFILATRSKARITGVEIQERLYEMAKRSNALNSLDHHISFLHADINHLPSTLKRNFYDTVTCNPPYFETITENERNRNPHLAIARHEIHCTLEDVIRVSSQCVKSKGKVALVHRPERLTDMIVLMRKYRIEPKRVQFVHPKEGKDANMVLLEGIKDGRSGMICLNPITVYSTTGTYTEAFKQVYEGERMEDLNHESL
ncbi:tRNA1(Val) (adenine(37)-N6)-methyltransferase [Halalkalibacter urbisdiaboli]|uniref:tRNA1(Val) (adenine(37)-N6)-methyltransferase n=1 Tax=Halalkalibacter urbisdiaboli TaxID=1960589 RepID=UPI000B43D030|nr:tRNA1(Val) (adenine(37)-N6)-methyltransferase [Halalkalibacter urbisdiaboli]